MKICKWSVAIALLLLVGMPVGAQEFQAPERLPGWSFTPSMTFGTLFDSNLTLTSPRADVGTTEGDTLFNVQPGGELSFLSRRTDFAAAYRGYLRRYMDVEALNGFDQRA
jgi:hypothetical protein